MKQSFKIFDNASKFYWSNWLITLFYYISATPRKSITPLDTVGAGIVVSTPDEEVEDWNGNENEEQVEEEEVLQVLEQL